MSIPAGIDSEAPVRARHETGISAPPDAAWWLHTDVSNWPAWQAEITAARLDGAFAPRGSFEWASDGFSVVSTIDAAAGQARVLWAGTAGGITGIRAWVFSPAPAGVHVTTPQSFAGPPAKPAPPQCKRLWTAHWPAGPPTSRPPPEPAAD